MTTQTAMNTNVDVPTLRTTMSNGNPDRAYALRQYRKLRQSIRAAQRMYNHPRCALDTQFRLADQMAEWVAEADELNRDWNFTNRTASEV